ncbi:hypothetical protein P3W45_000584 [Vairimorpha bombi]|jgi:hypothetical protein
MHKSIIDLLKDPSCSFFNKKFTDESVDLIRSCKDLASLNTALSDLFYKVTDTDIHTNITKTILTTLKYHKTDPVIYLKGISRHINSPGTLLYEHAVILTASIYEDSSFNFTHFKQIALFKDFMPVACFKKETKTKPRTKFDDKLKIENNLDMFTHGTPINYLQEGIQIIKDERIDRLDEVFNKLEYLIKKSSQRLLNNKYEEYYEVILSYDGYDLTKSDVIYVLVDRVFDKMVDKIITSVFGNQICLRNKICLLNVLVQIVEKDKEERSIKIRDLVENELRTNDSYSNKIVQYNLKYLLELCEYKILGKN